MRLCYHQYVQNDVNLALSRYDKISPKLADAFWDELQKHFKAISVGPSLVKRAFSVTQVKLTLITKLFRLHK